MKTIPASSSDTDRPIDCFQQQSLPGPFLKFHDIHRRVTPEPASRFNFNLCYNNFSCNSYKAPQSGTSGYAMVVHGRPKTPKNIFFGVIQPQGSQSPYILGDTTRPGHVTCVLVWSKSDQRQLRKTLSVCLFVCADRQTDRHYENSGHLAVNQLEMWANAQRDNRPAKHRWRPLFNAAKFGWRPLLHAVQ